MKKFWVVLAAVSALVLGGRAQAQISDGPEDGSSLVSTRLGLGGIVGVNAAYDYCLAHVWKGVFTIGGGINYVWDRGEIWGPEPFVQFHSLTFSLRTTYRFCVLVPEWEVYGGYFIGGGISVNNINEIFPYIGTDKTGGRFVSGIVAGTTYYFLPMLGANFEMNFGGAWPDTRGRLWDWISIGLTVKL